MRELLARAADYRRKWDEFEKKLAAWVPPKEGEGAKPAAKPDEAKKEGEGGAKPDAEKKDEEKKDAPKKKKGEEEPAKPVTGAWETKITLAGLEPARMRLYLLDEDGKLSGSLRCGALSDDLVEITGQRKDKKLTLEGQGSRGAVKLEAEEQKANLKGKVTGHPDLDRVRDRRSARAPQAQGRQARGTQGQAALAGHRPRARAAAPRDAGHGCRHHRGRARG